MLGVGKMEALTRIGFLARGIMYLMIGYFALSAGRAEDGAGVLGSLASGAGRLLLGVMAAGFIAYAIWRFSEALIDSEGHGSDPKGIAVRIGGAISGVVHLALGFLAAQLAAGAGSAGRGGESAREGTATALNLPGGWLLVTIAAAALVLVGLYQLVKAYRLDFLRHLDGKVAGQSWAIWTGRAGYTARGLVFIVMGAFFWQAGQRASASQAGGMDEAIASLPGTLQMIVAAGLLLFGIFSLIEARFRRINDPKVLERLKAAAHR